MNKLHQPAFLLLIVLLASACGNFEKVVIGEPESVQVLGFEDNFLKLSASVPVDNPTLHRITVKKVDVKVFLNEQYIGNMIVDENIVIEARKNVLYAIPVKIRVANILNTAFIMLNLKKGQAAQFRFNGVIKVQTMLIKKDLVIDQTHRVVM